MCRDIRRNRCPDTAAQTRFNLHGADGQTSKRKLSESIFHQEFFLFLSDTRVEMDDGQKALRTTVGHSWMSQTQLESIKG